MSAARGAAKREEKQRGTGEEINLHANYWRRDELMKKQNKKKLRKGQKHP